MGKPKKVPRRSKSPEHRRHGKRVSSSIAESPTQASQPKKLKSTSSQSSTTTGPEDSSLSTLSTTTVGPEGFSLDTPSATTVDQENPWLASASGPTVDLSGYLDGILDLVNNEATFQKIQGELQKRWEFKKGEISTGQLASAKKFSSIADIRQYWREAPVFKPNLLNLPHHAKSTIFKYVLLRKDADARIAPEICPFYHQGYKPEYSVFNPEEMRVIRHYGPAPVFDKFRLNLDLALLSVNKHLRTFCSRIFYSNHVFIFNDARSCDWFLRRIGRKNVRNLTNAVFNLSSGFFLSMEYRSALDVCEERRWIDIFTRLRRNQGLRNCVIRFFGFNPLEPRSDLSAQDKRRMTEGRLDLVAAISKFRGMEDVRIENAECEFLGLYERQQMVRIMRTSAEECPVGCFGMEKSLFAQYITRIEKKP